MPVFNGERFLDEAIASVLEQDFQDLELVIVDDGSIDATAEIVREWAVRDPRVVPVTLGRNAGVAAALNRGMEVARGQYVARHDADDVCLPGRLSAQVAALDADPEVLVVSAAYDIVDEHGGYLRTTRRPGPPPVTSHLLHFSNAVGHGQVMFRLDAVRAVGGYDEQLRTSEDYDLWTRLDPHGRFVILPIVAMERRIHSTSVSERDRERQRGTSLSISTRALARLLGRRVSDREADALAAVWRAEHRAGHAAAAHRLLAEAYDRFAAADRSRRHRRGVRAATAERWVWGAARLARRGDLGEAASYLAYAVRWHPLGAATGLGSVAHDARTRIRRRFDRSVTAA